MRTQLLISILLLCGARVILGQEGQSCGSAHDSDFSGNYTSSTSPDRCGGGVAPLLGDLSAPALQQLGDRDVFLALDDFTSTGFMLPTAQPFVILTANLIELHQFKLPTTPAKHIASRRTLLSPSGGASAVFPSNNISMYTLITGVRLHHFDWPAFDAEIVEFDEQIAALPRVFELQNDIRLCEVSSDCIEEFVTEAATIGENARERSRA